MNTYSVSSHWWLLLFLLAACTPYSARVPERPNGQTIRMNNRELGGSAGDFAANQNGRAREPQENFGDGGHYQVPHPFGSGNWHNLRCREGTLAVRGQGQGLLVNYQGREIKLKYEPSKRPLIYQNGQYHYYHLKNNGMLTDSRENPLLSGCQG